MTSRSSSTLLRIESRKSPATVRMPEGTSRANYASRCNRRGDRKGGNRVECQRGQRSMPLTRLFVRGMSAALAARNIEKLGDLVRETNARSYACDATERSPWRACSNVLKLAARNDYTPHTHPSSTAASLEGFPDAAEPADEISRLRPGRFRTYSPLADSPCEVLLDRQSSLEKLRWTARSSSGSTSCPQGCALPAQRSRTRLGSST